jgi:hypothetical protein
MFWFLQPGVSQAAISAQQAQVMRLNALIQ